MKKRKLLSFILALSLTLSAPLSTVAATAPQSIDVLAGSADIGGYVHLDDNYVPDVVNEPSVFSSGLSIEGAGADSISYNGVEEGVVTFEPYQQGNYNTCWAFAALGACKINARMKGVGDDDYSVPHMAYYAVNKAEDLVDAQGNQGGDYTRSVSDINYLDFGNNPRISMWQLASWIGPRLDEGIYSYEEVDPEALFFDDTEEAYLGDALHVENVYFSGISSAYRNNVKSLICNYGSVQAGYYSDLNYDSSYMSKVYDGNEDDYGNYYYNGASTANHSVLLIGWDDNYPKENFVQTPSENGAWLVMNSWGWEEEDNSKAQNGYFWLSYEDASLLNEGLVLAYDVAGSDNYDYIYQYDGACGVQSVSSKKVVQLFTLDSAETIEAVSVGISQTNRDYTASVYKISEPVADTTFEPAWCASLFTDGGSVISGTTTVTAEKLCEKEGTLSYAGYHTIPFDTVSDIVEEGSLVAVVIEFDEATNVYQDTEYIESDYWSFVTGDDEYRGIVSTDGTSYSALSAGNALRVKMFTNSSAEKKAEVSFLEDEYIFEMDAEDLELTYETIFEGIADTSEYYVSFEVDDETYFSLEDETNVVVPREVGGPVTVTATLYNGEGDIISQDTCQVSISSTLRGISVVDEIKITRGYTQTVSCNAIPSTATLPQLTWTSEDEDIATVDDDGVVTGVSLGTTTIKAAVDDVIYDSCEVTVVSPYSGIRIVEDEEDLEEKSIPKNAEITLGAVADTTLADAPEPVFTWTSDDEDIITVDEDGKIKAITFGTATVRVSCDGFTDSVEITVTGEVTGVRLNVSETSILKGRTANLIATALPEGGVENEVFTWSSTNENIVSVDDGVIKGVSYGDATVRVTIGNYYAECVVHVIGALEEISFNKSNTLIECGESETLEVTLLPDVLAEANLYSFASSDTNVATVNASGRVTAISPGECTITVTSGELSDTCVVTVDALEISCEGEVISSLTMEKGKTAAFSADYAYREHLSPAVTWTSLNPSIATVGSTGVVTAVAKGYAKIKATCGSFTAVCNVIVTDEGQSTEPETPGGGDEEEVVSVNVSNITDGAQLIVGQVFILDVEYTPSSMANATVSFASSDENILSVDAAGKLIAKGAGDAVITITVSGDNGSAMKKLSLTVVDNNTDEPDEPEQPTETTYSVVIDNLDTVKAIILDKTAQIEVSLKDSLGNKYEYDSISYTGDGTYISVSPSGVITGLKSGTGILKIVATIGDVSVSKTMYISVSPDSSGSSTSSTNQPTVPGTDDDSRKDDITVAEPEAPKPVYVKNIKLKSELMQISPKGGKTQIRATITPTNAKDKSVKWYSSNTRYASVTQSGLVKAKSGGAGHTVVITCKAQDGSGAIGSIAIKITEDHVKKLTLTAKSSAGKTIKKKTYMDADKRLKVSAAIKTTGKDVVKKLVWSSSNPEWASVDENGKVRAYEEGRGHWVTITATTVDGAKKASYKIYIRKLQKISVSKKFNDTYIVKKKTVSKKNVKLKLKAKTNGNGKLTYEVTKCPKGMSSYISVNKKGVVTIKKGAKKGIYKIKITASETSKYMKKTKTVKIRVK